MIKIVTLRPLIPFFIFLCSQIINHAAGQNLRTPETVVRKSDIQPNQNVLPNANININNNNNNNNNINNDNGNKHTKPVIYTFFEVPESKRGDKQMIEMHNELLYVWTKLWEIAGWSPQVLTMKDAIKHPDFNKYSNAVIVNESSSLHKNSYDYYCYMAWLAMSGNGEGGWLSSYDTFPMGISFREGLSLPNGGTFTGYERHVPALMSGSAHEWDRMTRILFEKATKVIQEDKRDAYSTMFALHDIAKESPNQYIREDKAYMGFPYTRKSVVNCRALRKFFVVHVSNYKTSEAVEQKLVDVPGGIYRVGVRAHLVRVLNKDWHDQCVGWTMTL